MRKSFYSLFLVLVSGLLLAQNGKELLDQASKKYKKLATYYIDFSYELKNDKTNVYQKQKGEVYASKQRYSLSLVDLNQIYNGTKLYTIYNDVQEVVITKPKKNSNDLLTPTKILDFYKKDFTISLDQKKTIKGQPIQYIKLTPINNSNVKYYLVGVNTSTKNLYQYKEINKENTETTLTLNKQLDNLIISKSIFKFDQEKYQKKGYFITE